MAETRLASDIERLANSLGKLPEPVVKPAFIVVSGLPGTGKSYLCHKLADRLDFIILESDQLRRVLFRAPRYDSTESSRLFQAIHILIERLLKRGIPLILDATNLSERYREYLYRIADHLDVKLILVRVEAPPNVVLMRLKARQQDRQSKSDADWGVYQKMRFSVEKMWRNHYAVDTSRDITPVLDKIVRAARR